MKNEKVLHAIGQIDDDLIEDAVIQTNKKKQPFLRTPAFRRVVAIAACFVLVVGLALSMPNWFSPNNDGPGVPVEPGVPIDPGKLPPPSVEGDGRIHIGGIDELAYYAAVRMIAGTPKAANQSMTGGSYGIALLASSYDTDKREEPPEPETTGPDETQGPPISTTPTPPAGDEEDIYYYALDPNEPFFIDKVSMFQILLTDENGFLASQLGLGIVDVVITENCIWGESLLTFRNGEKFYSCLTNGWGYDRETGGTQWDFSTHKYVEGFYIVKNLEQENYAFYIEMNAAGDAVTFTCQGTENGGDRPDQDVQIVSCTETSYEGRSFTVAELEEYFNSGTLPEGTTPPTQPQDPPQIDDPVYTYDVYSNGEYVFSMDSEGTFIFHHVSGQDVKYEKGTYVIRDDSLTFFFVKADEIIETVNCELTENGFIYKGNEYVKDPSLSQCATDGLGEVSSTKIIVAL